MIKQKGLPSKELSSESPVRRVHEVGLILHDFPVNELRNDLLCWWGSAKRYFPWRETQDPYKILIAEILLHRTRADQVAPLYELFLKRFPNIQALAKSSPNELTKLYHSAGLHWRWRLLHSMAVEIKTRFKGQIPEAFEDLVSLPGVSHYIASALRCFAFGYPEAILDTNTVRVAGRVIGLPITDSSRRSNLFRAALQYLLDPEHPREFNFAMIDFAATICQGRSPLHDECPLRVYCRFYAQTTGANNVTVLSSQNRSH
jgi:A/G-specific adenine glycosylase